MNYLQPGDKLVRRIYESKPRCRICGGEGRYGGSNRYGARYCRCDYCGARWHVGPIAVEVVGDDGRSACRVVGLTTTGPTA